MLSADQVTRKKSINPAFHLFWVPTFIKFQELFTNVELTTSLQFLRLIATRDSSEWSVTTTVWTTTRQFGRRRPITYTNSCQFSFLKLKTTCRKKSCGKSQKMISGNAQKSLVLHSRNCETVCGTDGGVNILRSLVRDTQPDEQNELVPIEDKRRSHCKIK